MKVSIIGSGSWGTALSLPLTDNGHDVTIYGIELDVIEDINKNHLNTKYLGKNPLPTSVVATSSLEEAIVGQDVVIFALPTSVIRLVAKQVNEFLKTPTLFVHVSKGIEPGTSKRISEMLHEELVAEFVKDVVVFSGPSHAEEVVVRHPTTITAACENIESAREIQALFSNKYMRIYTNTDVVGVELGGSLKNIIAVAAGVIDGLGYGDNAKAALMTRGLAEITRLGVKLGADKQTFAGLSGLGDLIVTCTSVHSRNWRCGNALGKGQKLDEILENMGMVVEGVRTTQAAYELGKKVGVDMPITFMLHDVLFNDADAKAGVDELIARDLKHEVEDVFI